MSIVINDTSPRVHYTSAAGQTVFDVPFEFLDINDVFVYVGEVLQTYNSTPQFNTEYNLIGVGTNDVRQVIFGGGGRLVGELVVIYRDMPIKSPADFPTDGVFPVDELNEAMDSLTAMIQQTEVNVLLRSLTLNWADEPSALNPLPSQAARANMVLGFDDEGQPIAVVPGLGVGGGGGSNADLLNGQPGSYYLDRTNHTGQDEMTDIIGLPEALALKAPLHSPVLTGEPQAVTPPFGDNDTSIATTAFVQMTMNAKLEDAPADAVTYGRKNAVWVAVPPEAPSDDLIYGRANKGWIAIAGPGSGGGSGGASIIIDPLPPTTGIISGTMWWDSDAGGLYIYYSDADSSQWVQVATPIPSDMSIYAKKVDIAPLITEEWGSWTPSLNFGGAAVGMTYGVQRYGRYRKSGKLVTVWWDFALSAKGSSSGTASIVGLPYTPVGTAPLLGGTISYVNAGVAGSAVMSCYVYASALNLLVYINPTTAPSTSGATDLHFNATTRIAGTVSYEVA